MSRMKTEEPALCVECGGLEIIRWTRLEGVRDVTIHTDTGTSTFTPTDMYIARIGPCPGGAA